MSKKLISMSEVIKISIHEWDRACKECPFEFGKVCVLIVDREHRQIAMTLQNLMPMPKLITIEVDQDFEKSLDHIQLTLLDMDIMLIKLEQSLYK